MKSEITPAREFLIRAAPQMRDEAAEDFLEAVAASDDGALDAACQKGEAARNTLRQQQGHALHEDVANALGLGLKADPEAI